MKRELHQRIHEMVEAEQIHDIDIELLNKLRDLAKTETTYWELPPEQRNALNQFFTDVKSLLISEIIAGNYGSEILLDAFLILCFEVGYGLRKQEEP